MPCMGQLRGMDRNACIPGADDIGEVEERKGRAVIASGRDINRGRMETDDVEKKVIQRKQEEICMGQKKVCVGVVGAGADQRYLPEKYDPPV